MIFWMSVLVFIAGIMTYMFFPRSDQFQINMFEEDPNIITFLNQHQAAKDYMYQMTAWHQDTQVNDHFEPYAFSYEALARMMAGPMRGIDEEMNDISESGTNRPEQGSFASSIVCLDNAGEMAACPAQTQYVMTYGYTPDWWSEKTIRHQVWLKSMLKRSHGAAYCGVFEQVGSSGFYAVNTGQRYTGFQNETINGKSYKVIPPAISSWLNTILPDEDEDILVCLSPAKNPYIGTPAFHWDSINNTRNGYSDDPTKNIPLVGQIDGDKKLKKEDGTAFNTTTYAVVGVLRSPLDGREVLNLNGTPSKITEVCEGDTCRLTAGSVTLDGIPKDTPYIFKYTSKSGQQTLTAYYYRRVVENGVGRTDLITVGPAKVNATGPALQDPNTMRGLLALRIYETIPSVSETWHNVSVDKKRFGF